ncbi:hypothetical protein ACLOJK_035701 [Asimina triloba]
MLNSKEISAVHLQKRWSRDLHIPGRVEICTFQHVHPSAMRILAADRHRLGPSLAIIPIIKPLLHRRWQKSMHDIFYRDVAAMPC